MRVLIIGEINSTKIKVYYQYKKLYPNLFNEESEIDSSDLANSNINHDYNKLMLFIEKTYDVVIANNVLEHIKNLDIFMLNIKQLLTSNGFLIIRTDNALYPFFYLKVPKRIATLRQYGFYGFGVHNYAYYNKYSTQDKHYHIFTLYHLQNLLSDYNFRILDVQFGVYKWFIKHIRIPLVRYFSPRILILAQKT